MRLSDIEEARGIRLFVKFVRSEFLDDLLDGNLFMSPLGDFIDQEKREKIRGQGDKYEGAHVFGIINAEIFDHETNQHIATATSGMVEETYSEIRKTPVFCFTKFSSDDFVLIEETEDQYLFKLSIPDEDKVKFLENFGDKAVLLPQDFPQIIKKMVDDTDDFCIVDALGILQSKIQGVLANNSNRRHRHFDTSTAVMAVGEHQVRVDAISSNDVVFRQSGK